MEGEKGFDFSDALHALKIGNRVTRPGWSGKGMWVVLIRAGNAMHAGFPMRDCLALKTARNEMQPGWVPSQEDLLAQDWVFLSGGR